MDDFNWDVVIRLATQGAKGSVDDLNKVAEAQDRLNRQGKITEKGLEQNTRSINRLSSAASSNAQNLDRASASTNSLRYANYDLSSTLFAVAAGFTAIGVASAVAFASQESAFTTVERIAAGSTEEVQGLRRELQTLSTEIPVSFNELSKIASLGAALDIPATSLSAFTEVVAKFAATTGVTVDAAATGFGKLAAYLNILPEDFDKLGSAVLRAGNISVATEEQVLKFSQALALPGARARLTADQVVALGATLASFGNINVEGAGSALSRVFANIERAVAEGGDSLDRFAAISGKTAGQFKTQWASDSGAAFNDIIQGLSGDVENLVGNMDALQVVNERDRRVISALAINYEKYRQILGETTSAWREGIYMNQAYGLVLDDLNSKWIIFINALTNAAAAVGATAAPALANLLGVTTDLIVAFTAWSETETGAFVLDLAGKVALLITIWAALRGALALATASALAFRTATSFLGGGGLAKGVLGLATALGIYIPAANGAATASWNLSAGLKALGKATVVIGVLQLLITLMTEGFPAAMYSLAQPAHFVLDVIFAVRDAFIGLVRSVVNAVSVLPGAGIFGEWSKGLADYSDTLADVGKETHGMIDGFFSQWKPAKENVKALNEQGQAGIPVWDDFGDMALGASDDVGDLGDSAGGAAQEVRTLVDYANDLAAVWDRAFDIRFSGQSTLDTITQTFLDMREASEQARRNIASLRAEIQTLESDINIQKRFLAVAIEYQDADRAQAIQANLAKLQAELAEKNADLSEEQAKNSKTLVGNSKAALQNREQIRGLVDQYQSHLQALAASGLSQEQLAAATERLRADFIRQATQLGFNRAELAQYSAAFDDVRIAIAKVPRNITVAANINPALQALNELEARAKSLGGKTYAGPKISMPASSPVPKSLLDAMFIEWLQDMRKKHGVAMYQTAGQLAKLRYDWERGVFNGYADGGFTGTGGKYQPAGIVHRGEYVIPKEQVNQRTGLPYADALGRLQRGTPGRSGYAGGGFVVPRDSAGGHIASFGPMAQQQLMTALRQIVTLDGKVVSDSSSHQYQASTARGDY